MSSSEVVASSDKYTIDKLLEKIIKPQPLSAAKNDFPVLQQNVYPSKKIVYLDSGASTQQCNMVLQAVNFYHQHCHSNVHRGVHKLSQKATDLYEDARDQVVKFINANSRSQVIFTRGATASINLIAQSYFAQHINPGDEILISSLEHHANIVPWQMLAKKTAAVIKVIPMDDSCNLDLQAYSAMLSSRTAIVALTHVSNAVGTVNPLVDMITKAHQHGAKVVVDGAQAVARIKVDVKQLGCDFYVFSGHKMYAPTGIGILYASEACVSKMTPVEGGGDMIRSVTFTESTYAPSPYCFEAGTPPIAAAIGLGAAIKYITYLGLDKIYAHEQELINYAVEKLTSLPTVRVIGSPHRRAGVVSWVHENIHPHDVGSIVDRSGVAVRVGHHCAMPLMKLLKVPATVRASFAVYNDYQDIDALIFSLGQVESLFAY